MRRPRTRPSEVRHRTFAPLPSRFLAHLFQLLSHCVTILDLCCQFWGQFAPYCKSANAQWAETTCRCSILRVCSGCGTILSYKKSKGFNFLMKRIMPPKPPLCTSQKGDSRCTASASIYLHAHSLSASEMNWSCVWAQSSCY